MLIELGIRTAMRLKLDCELITKEERNVSKRYCIILKTWYGKSIELRALNIIIIIDLIYKKSEVIDNKRRK